MEFVPGDSACDRDAHDPLVRALRALCWSNHAVLQQWRIECGEEVAKAWIYFVRASVQLPAQGWKLHLSANVTSAAPVLQRVFSLLLHEAACFKVASSLRQLGLLNKGESGSSQVGKFITIYPRDDAEAVHLALLLDEATRGLPGPHIPSDRALHPASLVHYRYGSFRARSYTQAATGLIEPALQTPGNGQVPDRRTLRYEAPDWVDDPFLAAAIVTAPPELDRMICERYLVVSTVCASINHIVCLGADLERGTSCIIKGPGYAWLDNTADRSMWKQLRHEATMLTQLAPNPAIPTLIDVVEQRDNLFLIMEDIDGEDLASYVSQAVQQGKFIALSQISAWGIALAEILETIHLQGVVYADLKSSNVLRGQDDRLYLIDFELACTPGSVCTGEGARGTRGYLSPQRLQGLPITVADDIYGLGALLYFLVTGAEPAFAPDPVQLLSRPLEWFRQEEVGGLKGVIERCLSPDLEVRYASMREVKSALQTLQKSRCELSVSPSEDMPAARYPYHENERYQALARALMQTLCAKARPSPDPEHLAWVSAHALTYGQRSRDINTGNAGTLLALAELQTVYRDASGAKVIEAAARWLQHAPSLGHPPLPGLYVGEAGVGAALLRAGQVLDDDGLIAAAYERSRDVAALPYRSPDLFHGTAGRLRFHLLLWDETHEPEQLCYARACGKHLLETAIQARRGEAFWPIPAGYGDLSGAPQLGYAHGAAGIGDALLDLYEVTGDTQLVPLIEGAARWLQQQAIAVLDDASGLSWPRVVGGKPHATYWCHGSAGIGQFFLHLAGADLSIDADALAARAARAVAVTTRWSGPTQCHGLAGNCEFLLDMYQTTHDVQYLSNATQLGRLLAAFAQEQDGHTVFSADAPTVFTPDYMVGYGGIALCLLRLSAPACCPRQLSRAGFRAHMCDQGRALHEMSRPVDSGTGRSC